MASKRNKSWREVRAQRPLDNAGVNSYRRLMEAEERLEARRLRRGVSDTALGDALDVSISAPEQEDDVYLSTLARYVAALGGYVEVRAVFPDETVTFLRQEDPELKPDPGQNR
jgi:hypothetical protein